MRESYAFNIAKQDGGIPLSAAQDGAMSADKHRANLFAQDLHRVLNGQKPKFRWQFMDNGEPITTALDAKPKHRAPSSLLPKNKAAQKRKTTVPPLARQQQSQSDKAALVERLYGGKSSLVSKLWPDA